MRPVELDRTDFEETHVDVARRGAAILDHFHVFLDAQRILVRVTAPLPLRATLLAMLADENLLLAHVVAKLGQGENLIRQYGPTNEQRHAGKHVLDAESLRVQIFAGNGGYGVRHGCLLNDFSCDVGVPPISALRSGFRKGRPPRTAAADCRKKRVAHERFADCRVPARHLRAV